MKLPGDIDRLYSGGVAAVRAACCLCYFEHQHECGTVLSYRALCCYCWTLIARGCREACLQ